MPQQRQQHDWKTFAGIRSQLRIDVAISASQAIEGTVITAAAALDWISWASLGSGTHTARTLSASITRAGIW